MPNADVSHTSLERAKRGDHDAFRQLAEPFRKELQLHCYRMLGSIHDAEDLVQETLLRAWRGLQGFQGRASFRNWLYRIATNACINALASRKSARRLLPERFGPPAEEPPQAGPASEIAWLEPYPDAALEAVPPPGPEARYEMHEAVQLAFIAAVQDLPPRQRAVLLLRDVLGWSSAEAAHLLDTSVASINSALQRARTTLEGRYTTGRPVEPPTPTEAHRGLLERYVRTWETADLEGFVALLREDAILSMPPFREWYAGREAIRRFFARAWGRYHSFRLLPTAANRQPAFALYSRGRDGAEFRAHSIQLLTLRNGRIGVLTNFKDPHLFEAFGLEAVLPKRFRDGSGLQPCRSSMATTPSSPRR